ncbi:hypothetical protein ENSA5_29670 [Enhygromyxa salina]|uniref:Lipoprotein n=1 Tax=Enhygromyxa salina TaxID=215803 RepID=A0A2S9Y047_9BACT|nr:hypothetical protein [Enhygromyxa salina]PRP98498.1 hypothetical protein ENSA5_29670 [Enhygromyxa salina]
MRRLVLCLALGAAALGCSRQPSAPDERAKPLDLPSQPASPGDPEAESESESESETGDPLVGEAAHVIPFADRTSMGYLLLLPPGTKLDQAPTREHLQALVEQAYPERRGEGELDLLLTLIATSPHTTDLGFNGELEPPSLDEGDEGGERDEGDKRDEREAIADKAERQRTFDLIGLHIELIHLGIGDNATIPSTALRDPVLTRELSDEQRASLLGRSQALLLRADYRNQSAVRGLRLLQTLVRVAAEHYEALIHDPDTLETTNLAAFEQRRLRAAAGNVADQIAIVPFPDPEDDQRLRLSTRGMRRFGSVDVELAGLPRDPKRLQQASDLIAGLALALVKEAEVDISGFAVEVPHEIEIDCELIRQSYSTRDYEPPCSGSTLVHLVERPPEPHDPQDHVVARIVAPRPLSDAPDYDHSRWVEATLDPRGR